MYPMTATENLKQVIKEIRQRRVTVSFAESCTGGRLSSWMTAQPGISDIFMGSIVSYSNRSKEDLLLVPTATLTKDGPVSEAVAEQMAQGVRRQLKSDWSIAVTGIAGPTGGTETQPVGTVWFAVAGPNFVKAAKRFFPGDRNAIQDAAVEFAVDFLLEGLLEESCAAELEGFE
jgi:PncC family amidohydrolase